MGRPNKFQVRSQTSSLSRIPALTQQQGIHMTQDLDPPCGPEFPAIKDSKRKDAVRSLAARLPHTSNQTSNHRPNGPLCKLASGLSTTLGLVTYREQDSNLHVLGTPDPKSGASTNSAIPASAGRLEVWREKTRGHCQKTIVQVWKPDPTGKDRPELIVPTAYSRI